MTGEACGGGDFTETIPDVMSIEECLELCDNNPQCKAVTLLPKASNRCHLKLFCNVQPKPLPENYAGAVSARLVTGESNGYFKGAHIAWSKN